MRKEEELVRLLMAAGGSCSGSASNGFYSDDDRWYSMASPHRSDAFWLDSKSRGSGLARTERVVDELGLAKNLCALDIGEQKDCTDTRKFGMGLNDFGFADWSVGGTGSGGANLCQVDDNGFSGYVGFRSSPHGLATSSDDYFNLALLGLQEKQRLGDLMSSYKQPNVPYTAPSCYSTQLNCLSQREQAKSSNHRGIHQHNTSRGDPYLRDAFVCSQPNGDVDDASICPQLMHLNLGSLPQSLAVNNENLLCNDYVLTEINRAMLNTKVSQSLAPKKGVGSLEGFSGEDSFVIQEKCLNYVINKGHDIARGYKKNSCNDIGTRNLSKLNSRANHGKMYYHGQHPNSNHLLALPSFSSLADIQGHIYFAAKDQNGCRYLQRVFNEGTHQETQMIFYEIINHVAELMMDQFGNYLLQKLLDVCNEEQRTKIVLMVTKEPRELARISSNPHGTRVIQKLIETLETRQQITLVKSALEPFLLALIKNQYGTHVVDSCLQCFSSGDTKFIFDNAVKFCVDVATHQNGCIVLQRCIAHSFGEDREKLVAEVSTNGLLLAQDPYGNYVVQYIIELKIPSAIASLISQFEGKYVHLAMQKCSSHVVEKCLKYIEESQSRIIHELLSVSHFEQLLQHPFANYVIQSALAVTKGTLRAALLEAVRAHKTLRTSPYCKRIFSRSILKK